MKPDGINNLIKKAFDFQAAKEAAEAVMGVDGRIRTKGQAAAEQVLQNHDNTQHWVDITLGMTQRQKEEHKCQQAAQAKTAGIDQNYNFDKEHSIDPTAGRPHNGTAFTQSRNISLGDTANASETVLCPILWGINYHIFMPVRLDKFRIR
jgi:hypothetical protein